MTNDVTSRAIAQIFVKVDGAAVPDDVLADLTEASLESSVHLPDMALLTFADSDFHTSDGPTFTIGAEIRVELGSQDLKREVFVGEITAIEVDYDLSGVGTAHVRAYDRAYRMHRGRRTRVFKRMSDSDIAQQIARELKLKADVSSTHPVHDYVLQDNRTDWEFLHDRAQRNGYELQVRGGDLVFKAPPSAPAEQVELAYGDNLLAFRAQLAASEQVKEVEVRGWDPIDKREIVGNAKRGETTVEVSERSEGGDLAQRSFNDHPKVVIVRELVANQAQADALAQAALNELAEAFITAEGEAIGDPRLRLGSEIDIKNAGERFSGSYFVTGVTHRYGPEGYRNEFTVSGRRPTDVYSLLAAPSQGGMQLMTGIVTNVTDDEHDRARVKVKLPTLGDDVESHWCRVVAPGAGAERGIQFLPEVDDEVLVVGSDVNQLFVLGGLWNRKDKPPEVTSKAVSGGKVEHRVIRSRTGHEIRLDDSSGSPGITIIDSTGNNRVHIDTRTNALEIAVDGDLTIGARGKIEIRSDRDVSIAGQTGLALNSQMGASLEAGTQLSLKGTASASLDGGASATLKAASVNIGP